MSLPIEDIKNYHLSQNEFETMYFYKAELQTICRNLNLNTSGTKFDLNQRIIKYINHEPQSNSLSYQHHAIATDLKLSTQIINGVKLNQQLRTFMADHYGKESFKFSKEMAVTIRETKANNDSSITIQTLIDINDGKLSVNTYKDDASYQWNQFVKDFCADSATESIHNKLKSAAILWKLVKNTADKHYSHELLKYLP
ncbi:hypothetical protein JMJ99_04155 [Companilactobacillus zhachilii]|uniref:SAP domain-containing protein n=1 Tax=Companilactobacillus zhachilii TaxID=2304606 RepID=UPI00192094F3|nr:SAP domain-containing protein [Companilactobacillus zhachilii]MBL3530552.1 hypothetical protein [Companilactobacillus zhachilii]